MTNWATGKMDRKFFVVIILLSVLLLFGAISGTGETAENGKNVIEDDSGVEIFRTEEISESEEDSFRVESIVKMGDIVVEEDSGGVKDMVAILGSIRLEGPAAGNIVAIFGDVEVNNDVEGDVVAIFGDVDVNRNIEGDVLSILGNVDVGATVVGDVTTIMGEIIRREGSEITGDIFSGSFTTVLRSAPFRRSLRRTPFWNFHHMIGSFNNVFRLLMLFGLALLVMALMSEKQKAMARSIEENIGKRLLTGFLGTVVIFAFMFLLIISCVGILFLPLIIPAILIINFIGYTAVAYFTGGKISEIGDKKFNIYLTLFLGILSLWLLNIVPFVGWIFHLLIMFLSLGTVIDTRFGTNKPWFKKNKKVKVYTTKETSGSSKDNSSKDDSSKGDSE